MKGVGLSGRKLSAGSPDPCTARNNAFSRFASTA
jgi:hypothetical protein